MQLTDQQMELAAELTKLQRQFVIKLVEGKSQREAYWGAGGQSKTPRAADANAARMIATDKVKAFYDALIQQAATEAVMTREEAMARLSTIARTTVKDVAKFGKRHVGDEPVDPHDPDGETKDVYQTVWEMHSSEDIDDAAAAAISEISASDKGLSFKLHSQLQAIQQLAKMQGWEMPSKHEHTGADGEKLSLINGEDVAEAMDEILRRL